MEEESVVRVEVEEKYRYVSAVSMDSAAITHCAVL